jgi:hypothetical protein
VCSASLLEDSASGKGGLEIIPVSDYESYKMRIDNKRGIEIEFVKVSN